MRIETNSIDPNTLYRPASVARRLGVNGSMVTYWMDHNMLDFVTGADGTKLIPEESIAALEKMRESEAKPAEEVQINEVTSLSDA